MRVLISLHSCQSAALHQLHSLFLSSSSSLLPLGLPTAIIANSCLCSSRAYRGAQLHQCLLPEHINMRLMANGSSLARRPIAPWRIEQTQENVASCRHNLSTAAIRPSRVCRERERERGGRSAGIDWCIARSVS